MDLLTRFFTYIAFYVLARGLIGTLFYLYIIAFTQQCLFFEDVCNWQGFISPLDMGVRLFDYWHQFLNSGESLSMMMIIQIVISFILPYMLIRFIPLIPSFVISLFLRSIGKGFRLIFPKKKGKIKGNLAKSSGHASSDNTKKGMGGLQMASELHKPAVRKPGGMPSLSGIDAKQSDRQNKERDR